MPSTSAKQHRFMQAVAHSPSFAKKAGVSQSVGKDFSAADKGKTFNKGGMMKKGKRFNGEDGESGVEYHDYDPDKTYSGRSFDDETGGLAENTPTRSTAKAAPAAPSRAVPARAASSPGVTPAAPSRAAPAASASSPGVTPAQEAYLSRREREKEKSDQDARELARTPRKRFSRPIFEADLSKRLERRIVGMKQGGTIMESKKMMGKEVAFMKKKGAPSSMIKHEKAEMGMEGGKPAFMKKFAKGGGIESRGKTKGTVIRMAAGGSVSSASRRADGIAQRGKTKFTNY